MPTLQRGLSFRAAGWGARLLVPALHATWRVQVDDPDGGIEGMRAGTRPAIGAFWHRHILTMLAHFSGSRVCVPASRSRDGEYVAQAMARFGFASVRGSTSRGSLAVVKGLLEHVREGWSPVLTPDGPRGPRYSVQPGIALIARRSGLPVYPVGVAARGAWELKSWDAFVIPRPWTRIAIVAGGPLRAEQHGGDEEFCEALRQALFAATERAEGLVSPRP